jgi:hypothetical protein
MTFSITSVTKGQWKKIGVVALWLLASFAASSALAYYEKNPALIGTTAPVFNLFGMLVKQFFTNGEDQAIDQLSPQDQALAAEIQPLADKLAAPLPSVPPVPGQLFMPAPAASGIGVPPPVMNSPEVSTQPGENSPSNPS